MNTCKLLLHRARWKTPVRENDHVSRFAHSQCWSQNCCHEPSALITSSLTHVSQNDLMKPADLLLEVRMCCMFPKPCTITQAPFNECINEISWPGPQIYQHAGELQCKWLELNRLHDSSKPSQFTADIHRESLCATATVVWPKCTDITISK